jgi:hypothetical protein
MKVARRLDPLVVALGFIAAALSGCGGVAASRQNISAEAARQQFAAKYVAALKSKDPARMKALIHPEVLACKNFAEYFNVANISGQVFVDPPGPGYKVTFTTLPIDAKPPLLPPDKFKYPIQPSHELQIDWNRNADGSSPTALIQSIAEKDGAWYLVYPCPNDEGMKFVHEMIAKGREQKEHALTLASQLQDPLKSELLALLKQGRKIDAIKKYQSTTGVDLTTAVQVIDVLQRAPH